MNPFEVPIAVNRMRAEGAVITSSESLAFQLISDAATGKFKAFSKLVKDHKESTKLAGEILIQGQDSEEHTGDGEIGNGSTVVKSAM